VSQERVHQGVPRMPGRGMHVHASGFVDDQEVFVFVDDAQGYRFRLDVERLRRRDAHVDGIAGAQEIRRLGAASIDGREPLVDQAPGMGAREIGAVPGNERVETLPFVFRDNEAERLLRQVLFSRQIVSLSVRNATIATTPTLIAESATLNAGQ
jgi:hypothetical protein